MNRILLVIFSCVFPVWIYAQSIRVSGHVTDATNKAIGTATVMLVCMPDNRLLEYCITDEKGNFALQYGKKVSGQLIVRHLSYETVVVTLPEQCDTVLNLVLSPMQFHLEEASIKGKRVPIQFQSGDWVVNVENFITPGTERSMDLLKKLPGMTVNEETKQIKMNGKNIELQLNGVPQPATFELLKSLPSNLLDQIVLTPTKRAEHDGPADNAIVNIKTKKKYIDGFMGNIDGSYGTYREIGFPGETEGSFFTMLMKKKFYLNLMFHVEDNKGRLDVFDSTWYGATQTSSVSHQRINGGKELATITNLNLSWDVKNGNRINANFYLFNKNEALELIGDKYNGNGDKSYHFRKNDEKRINPTGNIEYESSENLPFKLRVSYGYIGTNEDDRLDYQNRYADMPSDDYTYFYELSGRQHVLKLEASRRFYNKKLFVGLGGKANFARTTNDIRYEPVTSARQKEYFDYREDVSMGYVSLMYDCSDKVNLNAGLRTEYMDYDLLLTPANQKSNNHYWNLLPSVGVNLNASKKYNTSLTLSSGVARPNYNALTPLVTYVNDKFYYTGNPLLKPSKSFYLEWLNSLYRKINISANWQYTKDLYSTVLTDKGNEVTESSFQNCFDEWRTGINVYSSLSFIEDRLDISMSGEWYFGKYRNFREGFTIPRNRNSGLNASINFDYWLTGKYRLKIFGNAKYNVFDKSFQTDSKSNLFANIGIRYKCMEKYPLYVTLVGTDIFNTSQKRTTTYYDKNIRYTKNAITWQGVSIGLSYSFQGGKDLKRREVNGDVNDEDKRFDE